MNRSFTYENDGRNEIGVSILRSVARVVAKSAALCAIDGYTDLNKSEMALEAINAVKTYCDANGRKPSSRWPNTDPYMNLRLDPSDAVQLELFIRAAPFSINGSLFREGEREPAFEATDSGSLIVVRLDESEIETITHDLKDDYGLAFDELFATLSKPAH